MYGCIWTFGAPSSCEGAPPPLLPVCPRNCIPNFSDIQNGVGNGESAFKSDVHTIRYYKQTDQIGVPNHDGDQLSNIKVDFVGSNVVHDYIKTVEYGAYTRILTWISIPPRCAEARARR